MRTIHADRLCRILENEFSLAECRSRTCDECGKVIRGKYKRFFVSTERHKVVALVPVRGNLIGKDARYMLCHHDASDIKCKGRIVVNPHKKYSGNVVRFKIVSTLEEENLGDLKL